MPYGRRSIRTNRLRGTGRSTRLRKRYPSTVRKIWRRKPTARTQQKQIAAVTRLALSNARRFKSVYTDWQTKGEMSIAAGGSTWNIVKLTDFATWQSVMRADSNVNESNHTFIKRLQINLNCWVNSGYTYINCFIIRPRYNNAGEDPTVAGLQLGDDYVEGPTGGGGDVRLNPGKWKVMFNAAKVISVSTIGQSSGIPQYPGDPTTAFWRRQINLNTNIKVSTTNATAWDNKLFTDLPYYDQIYLCVLNSGTGSAFTYDQVATCINSL